MKPKKKQDPIETRRLKMEAAMVRRKTERVKRINASAPPPDQRVRVVVIVRPRVRKEEDTLEALLAKRMAEARHRIAAASRHSLPPRRPR